MLTAQEIVDRVAIMRAKSAPRDGKYMKLIAMRKGDYETVAPGLFNTAEFDRPLVANLIDTTARDIAEVMAPLPSVNCQSASLANDTDQKRQDLRASAANSYLQLSRLQDQMFSGADRYGSFGFMAYIVEPDYDGDDAGPVIRIAEVPTANYITDQRGRTRQYFEVFKISVKRLRLLYPDLGLENIFKSSYDSSNETKTVEVARWYDDDCTCLVLLNPAIVLTTVPNKLKRCPVRVVERPSITGEISGQYDDVIWVQVARALVQMYTMNAIVQSVEAPLVVPKDINELEMGPFAVIQTDNPGGIARVPLNISPGLFPESQMLTQEQQKGSRYPEGRSGSMDASQITGQGVQALMGTFDTQVQTFQRLNASALEDVIGMCFEMDEKIWGGVKKSRQIRDNGAPRKFTYTPSKDIAGDYTVDVTYGAIAGLDPNRGLVFVLQALAGGLIAKSTARKTLPVDLNVLAEERQIQLEHIDDSIAASIAALPQAIPSMAMQGQDPRQIVMQIAQLHDLILKGSSPSEAAVKVFAPPPAADEAEGAALPGQPPAPGAPPGGPGAGPPSSASQMLMSLAGMTPGGKTNLQSNVSRQTPIS